MKWSTRYNNLARINAIVAGFAGALLFWTIKNGLIAVSIINAFVFIMNVSLLIGNTRAARRALKSEKKNEAS